MVYFQRKGFNVITKITGKEWFTIIMGIIALSWIGIGVIVPNYIEYELKNILAPSSEAVVECPVETLGVLNQDAHDQIIFLPFKVTAYCPCEICCGKWADGVTASNYIIQPGDKFVAANTLFEFGDIVSVPGYGIVEVQDRGGKIKGWHIDVFFHTHQEAKNWGVQYLEVGVFLNDI